MLLSTDASVDPGLGKDVPVGGVDGIENVFTRTAPALTEGALHRSDLPTASHSFLFLAISTSESNGKVAADRFGGGIDDFGGRPIHCDPFRYVFESFFAMPGIAALSQGFVDSILFRVVKKDTVSLQGLFWFTATLNTPCKNSLQVRKGEVGNGST